MSLPQSAWDDGARAFLNVLRERDSGVVWAYSGIDLTAEVIKRFDAAQKAAPKK